MASHHRAGSANGNGCKVARGDFIARYQQHLRLFEFEIARELNHAIPVLHLVALYLEQAAQAIARGSDDGARRRARAQKALAYFAEILTAAGDAGEGGGDR